MIKFIIDTDSYSGNFERQMCAYSTGQLGDCEVGEELVEKEIKQKFSSSIGRIRNDRGSMTSVEIATTPGYGNNGLGFMGDGSPESFKKAKEAYIEYVKEDDLKKAMYRVEFYKNTKADNSRNLSELKRIQDEISELEKRPENEFLPYPAYQSVCIYFETLSEELIEILKKRSTEYAGKNKIKILNFRIVNPETEKANIVENKTENKSDIKVKVTAFKENVIIETLNPTVSDKDFHPNTGSNFGCSLSNCDRLAISKEALELLKQVKTCRDAIGDFMWDETSFSWIGGPLSWKN
ncbi:MAG TPA: hypothetical protein VNX68_05525, partial [Nitrosopumilaceae archaeon]|nr:hypothetical protein [Nitrosopumilaceae archaeon]